MIIDLKRSIDLIQFFMSYVILISDDLADVVVVFCALLLRYRGASADVFVVLMLMLTVNRYLCKILLRISILIMDVDIVNRPLPFRDVSMLIFTYSKWINKYNLIRYVNLDLMLT